jgi:hypothetical protein
MHNEIVNKKAQNAEQNERPGWDWAIRDAKQRIKRLRDSVRVFEKMRNAGEPWRGQAINQPNAK